MLQRGFSWKEHNDNHVWVYSKGGGQPKRTVTRKFGRITEFYGPEGSEADENITDFENSMQEFIHEARQGEHGAAVDPETAATLVAHLEMRSMFLRNEMSDIAGRLTNLLSKMLKSKDKSSLLLRAYLKNHPEEIEKQLDKAQVAEADRPAAREMISLMLPSIIDQASNELDFVSREMLEKLSATVPNLAMNAHNKALVADFAKSERAEQHRGLQFAIHRSSSEGLILPDTSLAFICDTGCTPFTSKKHNVELLIIPVAKDAAIMGKASCGFDRDDRTICRVLASCAYQSFLAPIQSDNLNRLSRKIGKNAQLVSDSELKKLLDEQNFLNL